MHRRLPRLLSAALVACVPALGLFMAFSPAAGAQHGPEALTRPRTPTPPRKPLAPRLPG